MEWLSPKVPLNLSGTLFFRRFVQAVSSLQKSPLRRYSRRGDFWSNVAVNGSYGPNALPVRDSSP